MSNVSFAAAMGGSKAPRLRPGTYKSIVTAVEPAEEYCEGKAVKISYALSDKSGKTFGYSEVFFVGARYERTRAFASICRIMMSLWTIWTLSSAVLRNSC